MNLSLKNRFAILLASFLFSLAFTKYYFLLTHEYYEPARSEKVAAFEADKVFQKRILPVILARVISESSGLSLDHALKLLSVLACMAILSGFHSLLRETTLREANPVLAYLVFIPVGWNYLALNSIYHAYDLPTLAFFCWGIVLFLRKRFVAFYLVYLIAGFNRESTCFITISIFALKLRFPERVTPRTLWNENRILLLHCFAQFLCWFANREFLEYTFRNNPGNYYEQTLSMTQFLLNAWNGQPSWPYLDVSTFLGNPRCFLTLFAGIWLLIPFLWKHIPPPSKKLLWIAPPYLLAAILHANLMESRAYHELNIVLTVAIISGFLTLTKKRLRAKETNSSST